MANLTNSQEPESEPEPVETGVFGSLEPEPEPLAKKNQEPEPEPLGKKIRSRSRSRLKKKSGAGAGAGKKFAGSPALENGIQEGNISKKRGKIYLSCLPV